MIDPRVKSQARGQNNWPKGIVHLCNLSSFGDMIKNKICNFLEFLRFSQFSIMISALFLQKCKF